MIMTPQATPQVTPQVVKLKLIRFVKEENYDLVSMNHTIGKTGLPFSDNNFSRKIIHIQQKK